MASLTASFKSAAAARVAPSAWDRAFARVWTASGRDLSVVDAVGALAPLRTDLGRFLDRMSALLPSEQLPVYVSLDADRPAPRLKPNNPRTAQNGRIEPALDPNEIPEHVTIRVVEAQQELDIYYLPVELELAPPTLSFRMAVESQRPLAEQLLIRVNGKWYLTKEPSRRTSEGTWELLFLRAGEAIPPEARSPRMTVEAVGFTPLERDGRYGIGPIEAFVDSAGSGNLPP
jgi:hypothetical protein